jgi:OOP family OmpA-OmpF porin
MIFAISQSVANQREATEAANGTSNWEKRMRMYKRAGMNGLTILCLIVSGTVHAAEESGPYLGAGIGTATNEDEESGLDDSDTAFKLFGGYSFNKSFAVELAYLDAGTMEERFGPSTLEIDASGLIVSAIAAVPLGQWVSVFGKLGYAFYDVEATLRNGNSSISESESDEDLAYGIGVKVDFNKIFGLRAEYEVVDVPDGDFNTISVGGVFRF